MHFAPTNAPSTFICVMSLMSSTKSREISVDISEISELSSLARQDGKLKMKNAMFCKIFVDLVRFHEISINKGFFFNNPHHHGMR